MFAKSTARFLILGAFGLTVGLIGSATLFFTSSNSNAIGPQTNTVVGINPGVEPYLVTLQPDNGVQPIFGTFVTQACRDTLHVGDAWPSANPVCH